MVKVKAGDLVKVTVNRRSRNYLISTIFIGRVRQDNQHQDFYVHVGTLQPMYRRNGEPIIVDGLPLRKWYIAYSNGNKWQDYEVIVLG